jgi:tRNA (mo5U34)-methyltransferase
MSNSIHKILDRKWFYKFELPNGKVTESYLPDEAQRVHTTRLEMMDSILNPRFEGRWGEIKAVDIASHEGFFSCHLAKKGTNVLGLEAREEHVDDANEMAFGMGLADKFYSKVQDVHTIDEKATGTFDIVLMLGLIYHLENPVGAIRKAHALCKDVCLIETQVAPNLSGQLDWGNYTFVKPMMGSFAIIDETEETHGPEMSTTGICLAPSIEALMWIMRKVGFKDVKMIEPEEHFYEQHRFKKRVMIAGYV